MSDRLQTLQGELQSILDEKMAALQTAIANAEETTRGIVTAELEIARNEQEAASMAEDTKRLEGDLNASKAKADKAREANDALRKERDELGLMLAGVEEEGADLRGEVQDLRDNVAKAEATNAKLQAEQESLKGKLQNLEDTASKMRALKAELMSSIKQNMDELAGGN